MNASKVELAYSLNQDFIELLQSRVWLATPEHRLLFAMLERGARDFLGTQKTERESATEWFFSDRKASRLEPFSFAWVCEHVGIHPEEFLARLITTPARASRIKTPPSATEVNEDSLRNCSHISIGSNERACVACAA